MTTVPIRLSYALRRREVHLYFLAVGLRTRTGQQRHHR